MASFKEINCGERIYKPKSFQARPNHKTEQQTESRFRKRKKNQSEEREISSPKGMNVRLAPLDYQRMDSMLVRFTCNTLSCISGIIFHMDKQAD